MHTAYAISAVCTYYEVSTQFNAVHVIGTYVVYFHILSTSFGQSQRILEPYCEYRTGQLTTVYRICLA